MKYLFTLILCLVSLQQADAQSLSLFNIDASNFPTMKGKFYAFDAAGKQLRPSTSELTITENGQPRTITSVTCPPPTPQKTVSVAMSIDVSGSMGASDFGDIPVELGKLTALTLCNQIAMPPSEFALQTCDDRAYILQDYTTDRNKILKALTPVNAGGNNDFVEHLLNKLAGLLNVAKNGKFKKVAVLYTDAWWYALQPAELQACLDTCKKYSIEFYAVIYSRKEAEPNGIKASLQQLANQTGGYLYDGITSKTAAEDIAVRIQHVTQGDDPCEIVWTSDVVCQSSNNTIELTWQGLKSQVSYTPLVSSIASLLVEPSFVAFGKRLLTSQNDVTITLTAQNADFTVTGISRTFGSADFSVVNTNFPLIIPQNTDRTITLRFIPSDSSKKYTSFEIETDKCIGYFSTTGGFPGTTITTSTLKLTKPNGGEAFVVGSDTAITWIGVAPSDIVSLEYTTDNEVSWQPITTSASNLKYVWKNIPKPVSNLCKVRVKQSEDPGSTGTPGTLQFDLLGHTFDVTTVQWSPDGSKVATSSYDNTAIIWSAKTGAKIFTLKGHTSFIRAVQWCPDGTKIVTASVDNTAIIWSATTGAKLFTLSSHIRQIWAVQWSPDGTKIVTASGDKTAIIWSATSGIKLHTLSGHTADVEAVQWSPDGTKVATAGQDNSAIIWSADSGANLFVLKEHTDRIRAVQWSPDGTKVATASHDYTAIIWSATTGTKLFTLSGHKSLVFTSQWSPDGRKIATTSDDNTAIIWSATTGTKLVTLNGHTDYTWDIQWSPDGTKVATSSGDHTAIIWSAISGIKLYTLRGHTLWVISVQWSPDGTKVATSSQDKTAKIWFVDDISLQADTSDTVFSIVAPSPASQNIDMLQCLVGSVRDSLVSTFVQNTGTYPYRVNSIQILGTNASQFSLVSGIPPFDVPAGGSHAVEFRFRPSSVGVKTAQLLIFTQADTLRQTIRGEGIAPALGIIEDVIDFGVVKVGTQKDTLWVITIKNIGSAPLTITSTRHAGPNDVDFTTLLGGGNFTLEQGDTARFNLRFSPKDIGRTSGRLLFDYNGVGSPATVQLFGEGVTNIPDTASTTIVAQDITAQAGEKVNLILKLQKPSKMEIVGAPTDWYARIHYNKSILFNEQTSNVCPGTTDSCVLELTGVYNPKTEELISIPCITTLGNTDHSTIVIDTFFWTNSAIVTEVATQNGSITLNGVCEDGGVRLFIPAKNSTSLTTRPNPAQDNLQIQYGLREPLTVTLELLTMTGQFAQTIVNNQAQVAGQYTLTSDLSLLGNGVYLLRMRTNKEMLTTRVDVVK